MNELDNAFAETAKIAEKARENAYRKASEGLISMRRRVGRVLSEKSKADRTPKIRPCPRTA